MGYHKLTGAALLLAFSALLLPGSTADAAVHIRKPELNQTQVSKNWQQTTRAWKARGGRKSLRMFAVLLPVFFSVGMKQAYNSARAISARIR